MIAIGILTFFFSRNPPTFSPESQLAPHVTGNYRESVLLLNLGHAINRRQTRHDMAIRRSFQLARYNIYKVCRAPYGLTLWRMAVLGRKSERPPK